VARLIGPDESVRLVYRPDGTARAQGYTATVYADPAGTQLADIINLDGTAVTGSVLTVDAYSRLPLFQFPNGVDTVYATVNGGPIVALYARTDDRLDTLSTRVTTLETSGGGGGGGGAVTSVAGKTGVVTLVAADVSGVETPAGAQAKADAASAFAVQRSNHTGTQSADTVVDGSTNKAYTGTERTKLAGVATGATANATDAQLRDRSTHTGTQSADSLTDGTTNKAFLATERTKLAGVATGATANATDAQLRDRSTHTGTQAISTVSGLQAALDAATGGGTVSSVAGKTGAVTLVVADVSGAESTTGSQAKADAAQAYAVQRGNHTGTQSADTVVDGTTNAAYLLTERTKLAGVAAGATANATDSQLRDRSTHTGTQLAATISDLGPAALLTVGTTAGTVAAGDAPATAQAAAIGAAAALAIVFGA
jgi:hypothetical protein